MAAVSGPQINLYSMDVARLVSAGTESLSPPHTFLDGRLRSAWVRDLDGNPIQLVQRLG